MNILNGFIRIINKILSYIYVILRDAYDTSRYIEYKNKYDIDPTFKFRGPDIIFFGNGKIKAGKNSYIGKCSILESMEDCKIIIGKNCAIGPYVKMYTKGKFTNQNLDQNPFGNKIKYSYGDITIGNGCWIGANVGINFGVKIGNNTIIGMNSVVTKDIPSNSIAVGSPAKIVKFKSNSLKKFRD